MLYHEQISHLLHVIKMFDVVIQFLHTQQFVHQHDILLVPGLLIHRVQVEPLIIMVDQALVVVMVLMMLQMRDDLFLLFLLVLICQENESVNSVCLYELPSQVLLLRFFVSVQITLLVMSQAFSLFVLMVTVYLLHNLFFSVVMMEVVMSHLWKN